MPDRNEQETGPLQAEAPVVRAGQIIDRSAEKSKGRKFLEGSITAALWTLWLYLISPALTILIWFWASKILYKEIVLGADTRTVLEHLGYGAILVVLIAMSYFVWWQSSLFAAARAKRNENLTELSDTNVDLVSALEQAIDGNLAERCFIVDGQELPDPERYRSIRATVDEVPSDTPGTCPIRVKLNVASVELREDIEPLPEPSNTPLSEAVAEVLAKEEAKD